MPVRPSVSLTHLCSQVPSVWHRCQTWEFCTSPREGRALCTRKAWILIPFGTLPWQSSSSGGGSGWKIALAFSAVRNAGKSFLSGTRYRELSHTERLLIDWSWDKGLCHVKAFPNYLFPVLFLHFPLFLFFGSQNTKCSLEMENITRKFWVRTLTW